MDDGRSSSLEEMKPAENLPTPATNDLWFWAKPPHVPSERETEEGGKEGGKREEINKGVIMDFMSEPVGGMVYNSREQLSCVVQ